ncbi:hypothetical protein L7F22_008521 [Adiantum nelumboides]|nr:hypothetical protein [Adiantum nelumboides]
MPTLRSQTASLSGKGKGVSDDADMTSTSLVSPPPLGPATPTQDHEFARTAGTPVIRRSRRLSVEAPSAATPEWSRPRRKAEGKRKAEEALHDEVSCKALSLEASTLFSQGFALENRDSSTGTTLTQERISGYGGSVGSQTLIINGEAVSDIFPGSSLNNRISLSQGCDSLVNKHDVEMQFEVGDNSVKLESVEEGYVASIPSQEIELDQQELEPEVLQRPQIDAETPNRGRGTQNRAEASRFRFLQIARDRAFHFAHFDAEGNEAPAGAPPPQRNRRRGRQPQQADEHNPQPRAQPQEVDWPGPFSTARQLVNNRAMAAAARKNADAPGIKVSVVDWKPTRVSADHAFGRRICPSLQDLCLSVLANNADNVVSLQGVPDLFRIRISDAICERRNMSPKVLSLFFQEGPSEIHSLDCTQVCEDDLVEMMRQICPGRLEKLHLGYCGRALSERCLLTTIAGPATVTLLKSISLRGAYRLSDQGLEALLQASPQLVHLDLSNCSFLTNAFMGAVARCVSQTIESLVLDGCSNLNATVLVHEIVQLAKLQKLSLAEVGGVTDEVVTEICVQLGSSLKELALAGCYSLTDAAAAAIGSCCPSLQSLNLAHLPMLTDITIAHITDNVRNIQDLDLKRCKFSDEAIATFVTASGASLLNLSLNSVQQVAGQTIMALARHSNACLERLDLSFSRLVDDECLGYLADSCLKLQELRLFGCTQITDKFLNGHSNGNLKVVGLTYPV